MFRKGKNVQQKNLFSPEQSLPPGDEKMLNNSWAEAFFETIYLVIREERFAVLAL